MNVSKSHVLIRKVFALSLSAVMISGCMVTGSISAFAVGTPQTGISVNAGVTLNKTSLTLGKGETAVLTASQSVTWKSDKTSVVTVSGGKLKAVSEGTATVTAKAANGSSATCKVTVKAAAASITLNKTSLTLGVGESFKFISSVKTGAANQRTFTSSNSSVLKITGTTTGTCTVKALKTGTATITVKTYNGKTAHCQVTVKAAAASITLNKTSLLLGVGESFRFTSSVKTGAANQRTFTSSNSSVLKITETTTGTCTVKALKTGTATITVKTYNGKTANCQVTVKAAAASITLNKTSLTLEVGESFKFISSVKTGAANQRTFTSSNSSVLKITETTTGTCTVKALKAGTSTVTVKTYNGKTASCKVTVKAKEADSVKTKFRKLANYLKTNGTLSDSGIYSLDIKKENKSTGVQTVYGVGYDSNEDYLMLMWAQMKDSGSVAYVDSAAAKVSYQSLNEAEMVYNYVDTQKDMSKIVMYSVSAYTDPAAYTADTDLAFKLDDNSFGIDDMTMDEFSLNAKTKLNYSFRIVDEFLKTKGFDVSYLGFTSWK